MTTFKPCVTSLSDIGLVRSSNQDSLLVNSHIPLFAIADGMGGHKAGDIASSHLLSHLQQHFCSYIPQYWAVDNYRAAAYFLQQGIQSANNKIHQMGKELEYFNMGSTLCCIFGFHQYLIHAHVGDSRIYLLRKNKLVLLTEDHSLIEEVSTYLEDHTSPVDVEFEDIKYKHVLTRAIGTQEKVTPSISVKKIQEGDLYLLCSDGLSDSVGFTAIESILNQYHSDLNQAAKQLIHLAKVGGGRDNISVLLIRWDSYTTSDASINHQKTEHFVQEQNYS